MGHEDIARAVDAYYSNLIGSASERNQALNMEALGFLPRDMTRLEEPFIVQEVEKVIKCMPMDKAPGPDGFTGRFYATCWHIIREDFMRALEEFHGGNMQGLHAINKATVSLLPKKIRAIDIKDYSPVSLNHSAVKIFDKILATRLADDLPQLVGNHQNAFVRGRSLHDNFMLVQGTACRLHALKDPTLLLKLDISKAFDSVQWPFLLEVLAHMGFRPRWMAWICGLLATSSTKIAVNGIPGERIFNCQGLCQGSPLSPMLFILCMEPLHRLLELATTAGLLSPLARTGLRHRVSMYADDVMVFLKPMERDLRISGVATIDKEANHSTISGYGGSDDREAAIMEEAFYGMGKKTVEVASAQLLGKLYADPSGQRVDRTRPWAEFKFLVPDEARGLFQAAAKVTVGNGNTALFWEDRWLNGYRIQELAPLIYDMVSKQTRDARTVAEAIQGATWARDVGPNMNDRALLQFLEVWPHVHSVAIDPQQPDQLKWSWEKDGKFSARSSYAANFAALQCSPTATYTWASRTPLRCRFFAWLALRGRVWTSDRLARRGLPHQDTCPFCDQNDETINHLMTQCVFVKEVWTKVGQAVGMTGMTPSSDEDLVTWCTRPIFEGRHAKTMRAIHLLVMWELWKHRNAIVFEGMRPGVQHTLRRIASECGTWRQAGVLHKDIRFNFIGVDEWSEGE
ncbi:uncharacterized protein [Aegilops tauschii subsp. strangulata]|uniref:uncharacterized protein n=1 Tax=Aegilops tauschii subsp. strangulata TaxID=200361 RepID=UPI003CC84D41